MSAVLDTTVLVALLDSGAAEHDAARKALARHLVGDSRVVVSVGALALAGGTGNG